MRTPYASGLLQGSGGGSRFKCEGRPELRGGPYRSSNIGRPCQTGHHQAADCADRIITAIVSRSNPTPQCPPVNGPAHKLRSEMILINRRTVIPTWHRLLFGLCIVTVGAVLPRGPASAAASEAPPPPAAYFCAASTAGRVVQGDPSNYRTLLAQLGPGDTLRLAAGSYRPLTIAGVKGAPGRCVTITGPTAGPRAIIIGEPGHNTLEIADSSYLVVANLTIDSHGIPGAYGIAVTPKAGSLIHHIIIDGNLIIGAGATQQTDGISTKMPTWNWVIRRNMIVDAGTAIYLGDSDGSKPFVAGIIENNLVLDPLGYCM